MENFKEIAEKCLAGELSGIFIFNVGAKLHSQYLKKSGSANYFYLREFFIDKEGQVVTTGIEGKEIIDFIPDSMQKQIKINIPEGKVPVMEYTESGVVITWKKKELTYDDIVCKVVGTSKYIAGFTHSNTIDVTSTTLFYKKVEVLRKLTNIRNYFGKPEKYDRGYCIEYSRHQDCLYVGNVNTIGVWVFDVLFKEREHAEQAIKMLGDELKYLFEPW